jgi:hypothetical protein
MLRDASAPAGNTKGLLDDHYPSATLSAVMSRGPDLLKIELADRAMLPSPGSMARLLYREAGTFGTRGVIRLTCGSTRSEAFAPAIIGSIAMTQFLPPSLAA